jgi:hypothetical protein
MGGLANCSVLTVDYACFSQARRFSCLASSFFLFLLCSSELALRESRFLDFWSR